MADVATGRNCPNDGTLVACSGNYDSETLVGRCAVCGQPVSAMHHRVESVTIAGHPVASPTFVQVHGDSALAEIGTVTQAPVLVGPDVVVPEGIEASYDYAPPAVASEQPPVPIAAPVEGASGGYVDASATMETETPDAQAPG